MERRSKGGRETAVPAAASVTDQRKYSGTDIWIHPSTCTAIGWKHEYDGKSAVATVDDRFPTRQLERIVKQWNTIIVDSPHVQLEHEKDDGEGGADRDIDCEGQRSESSQEKEQEGEER